VVTFYRFGTDSTEEIVFNLGLISKMTNLRNQPESITQLLCTTLALNLGLKIEAWQLLFVGDLAFCCNLRHEI